MPKKRVTLVIEEENDRKLEVVAAVEGKTKSEIVDQIFENFFSTKDYLNDLPFASPNPTASTNNKKPHK